MRPALVNNRAALPLTHERGYEDVACNLCGSRDRHAVYEAHRLTPIEKLDPDRCFTCTNNTFGDGVPIVRCNDCGLMYQNPRPTTEAILEAYRKVVDIRYDQERDGRLLTFKGTLDQISKHEQSGRILDVGCHTGVFLQVAKEHGWDVSGVEPSEWASNHANRQGLQVYHGTLSDLPKGLPAFDVVTCWDVIEHFSDPKTELLRIRQQLRPKGLVAICTMNVESLFPRLVGRRWPWFMQMHLYYFSHRTLKLMLRRAGFEVVEFARHRRIVRLEYLISRLNPYSPMVHRVANGLVHRLKLGDVPVPVDLGDIFVTFARRTG